MHVYLRWPWPPVCVNEGDSGGLRSELRSSRDCVIALIRPVAPRSQSCCYHMTSFSPAPSAICAGKREPRAPPAAPQQPPPTGNAEPWPFHLSSSSFSYFWSHSHQPSFSFLHSQKSHNFHYFSESKFVSFLLCKVTNITFFSGAHTYYGGNCSVNTSCK